MRTTLRLRATTCFALVPVPVIRLPSAPSLRETPLARAMRHSNEPEPGHVTRLLARAREGDADALDDLFPLVYETLKRISRRQLGRGTPPSTLSTTELVHETYMKLVPGTEVDWEDRHHFYSVAARAMRQVLVDRARRRMADKRGGNRKRVTLTDRHLTFRMRLPELLGLDEALNRLEDRSERLVRVVELRFFGGLTAREVAEVLDVSSRTVERDWTKARLFLHRELYPNAGNPAANGSDRLTGTT